MVVKKRMARQNIVRISKKGLKKRLFKERQNLFKMENWWRFQRKRFMGLGPMLLTVLQSKKSLLQRSDLRTIR